MKKLLFLFAGAALIFSACSDDDNAGNGGDNGSDGIRHIKVDQKDISSLPSNTTFQKVEFVVDYGNNDHTLLTSTWSNGFLMELPASVSSSYLSSVYSLLDIEEEYDDYSAVNISNVNAKVTTETNFELFSSNNRIGYLYVSGNDDNWKVWYLYSDSNVNIKGTHEEGNYRGVFDLELKKGWNRVASSYREQMSEGQTMSIYEAKTNLPSSLHWKFSSTRLD